MRSTLVKQRGITITFALVVTGGLLAPLAPAQAADQTTYASATSTAQAAIEAAVAAGSVDSITIGLTDANGLIWTSSAGRVTSTISAPTATTMFGIGSVTKVITTAAVMQLVDQGRIGLDQPIVSYLPSFTMLSPQYRQITVRMLLNHSAGFPGADYANGFTTSPFPGYAKQAINTLSHGTLKTTPGALSVYCNDCFTVAGEVVAAVSGMPFTTYVERNLLQPIGMGKSTFITKAMPVLGTVARTFEDGVMRPQEVTNVYASGGLLSTPADMSALARMFLNKGKVGATSVLTPQSVEQMGHDQIATTLDPGTDPYLIYGLGWDSVSNATLRFEGVRGWSKNGATGDYHADFVLAPDAGLAVFASAAGEQPGIDGVPSRIAEALLVDALRAQGTIGARSLTVNAPGVATPTEDDVNAMLGTYLASAGGSMRVTATGQAGVLQVSKLAAGAWSPLEQVSFRADGSWWPTNSAAHSWFSSLGWARNYLVQSIRSGDQAASFVVAERVLPSGSTAATWNKRMGVWLNVNERVDSLSWSSPATLMSRIPGTPGYIDMGGTALDAHSGIATVFAQVPVNNGRDQNDAVPLAGGLLRSGYEVYRSAATVPALASGSTTITIGADGYGEWVRLLKAGRVTVAGAEGWHVYSAEVGSLASGGAAARTVAAPSGALVVVLGQPGTTVQLTVR